MMTPRVVAKIVTPPWQTVCMEAAEDFIAFEDEGRGTDPARPSGASRVDGLVGVVRTDCAESMDAALAALRALSATAVEDAASWDFRTASDFAGQVEEFSRAVEYLQ